MSPPGRLGFQVYVQVFNTFGVGFGVEYKTGGPVFPTPTPRETVLSPLCVCGAPVEAEHTGWVHCRALVPFHGPVGLFSCQHCAVVITVEL